MQIKTWEMLDVFEKPINGNDIKFVDSDVVLARGVDDIVRQNWNRQLRKKMMVLEGYGIWYEVNYCHLDRSKDPLYALYLEGSENSRGSVILSPDPVVALIAVQGRNSGIDILVWQTCQPFIDGLNDPDISKLYNVPNIAKLRPFKIATYAATNDGLLTLTVRSRNAHTYPGRLDSQVSNPLFTNVPINELQQENIINKISVRKDEYDPNSFKYGGLIADDTREHMGVACIFGWVSVNLESGEIEERMNRMHVSQRPSDSVGVRFAPTGADELFDYLVNTPSDAFCPIAHGGLFLYGYHNYGLEWVNDLFEKLE